MLMLSANVYLTAGFEALMAAGCGTAHRPDTYAIPDTLTGHRICVVSREDLDTPAFATPLEALLHSPWVDLPVGSSAGEYWQRLMDPEAVRYPVLTLAQTRMVYALLTGERQVTIASLSGIAAKTVASHKRGIRCAMNVVDMAELHSALQGWQFAWPRLPGHE
ncbi:hypothetical protein ACNJNU_05030 [Citrobacter freundii]|uniref:hypothetical protein n=1 Tax=Citrobacter freundii TaxID=546 RepID=UPI003A86B6DF